MKKIIIKVLLVLLALLVLFIALNLFDARDVPPGFSAEDVPIGTFDKKNGFYRLWSLIEPEGTDIQSDEVINRVRHYFDPQFDNDKYLKAFDLKTHKAKGAVFKKIKMGWPKTYSDNDWVRFVLTEKGRIRELEKDFSVYLHRYRQLIDCEIFEDFTLLRWDSPIPNLLAWLRMAKLYIGINVLEAKNGNWKQAVSNLLDHVNFGKRAVKGSHVMITDLIAKAVTQLSIKAIADLMNQKECPREIFQLVLDNTPPLHYEEYGTRTSFIAEGLVVPSYIKWYTAEKGFFARLFHSIFFHENRVKKIHYRNASRMLKYEGTPPYKWEKNLETPPKQTSGWFWWLQNPLGKILMDGKYLGNANFNAVIYKSFRLKALYEMLRISAELHLNYTADKPVQEILNGLETYKTLIDSGSGKPYTWNDEKQILYSIGIDRKDNGGQSNRYEKIEDTDYPLPVILYITPGGGQE